MQSQGGLSEVGLWERFKQVAYEKWESLSDRQRLFAKKVWGVITYKWRWQIAMNIPYLLIFLLDRIFPAVHEFNINVLNYIFSKLPIPQFISSFMGLS